MKRYPPNLADVPYRPRSEIGPVYEELYKKQEPKFLDSKVYPFRGLLAFPAGDNKGIETNSLTDFEYIVRIGISDPQTIALLTLVANPWDVQYQLSQGYRNSQFQEPPALAPVVPISFARVPVKGIALQAHGSRVQLVVRNFSNSLNTYRLALDIVKGRLVEHSEFFENSSGGDAPFAEFTHNFRVYVPGGVALGDSVEIRDYTGALVGTFPAGENRLYPVTMTGASARYVPVAGVVTNLQWEWNIRK